MRVVKERLLVPVLERARTGVAGDGFRRSALERLAREESRQIALLERLRHEFERGFGSLSTLGRLGRAARERVECLIPGYC